MLCSDGILSLFCFIATGLISPLSELLFRLELDVYIVYFTNIWFLHTILYILINVLAYLAFRGFTYQVSVASHYCMLCMLKFYTRALLSFTGGSQSIISWIRTWNWYFNINHCIAIMADIWNLHDNISKFPLFGISNYSVDKSNSIVNRQFYSQPQHSIWCSSRSQLDRIFRRETLFLQFETAFPSILFWVNIMHLR